MVKIITIQLFIYRSNNSRYADLSLSQMKSTEKTSSAAVKDIPKRLFKISDIGRLNHTSLSSALIKKPKTVNINECFNLLQTNDKHNLLQQNRQLNTSEFVISAPKKPVVEQDYNEDTQEQVVQNTSIIEHFEDIPDYDPSYIEGSEVKDIISDIDQTMFNPKTLLQYFNNDEPEDIIPPPPEFSDYLNTTSDYTTADTNCATDCYEPIAWEEENYVSREEIPNRSIFQDYSQVELTPSKEIETWSLSQDEGTSCKMYVSPGVNPYSFTMMRNNKEATAQSVLHNSSPQSNTLSRQKKLGQFKFNHKNKFKFTL